MGQLYPQAKILVDGFEHTNLPDNSIDLAVGNVPLELLSCPIPAMTAKPVDTRLLFAKTLDKVRPGGIVAFISSRELWINRTARCGNIWRKRPTSGRGAPA